MVQTFPNSRKTTELPFLASANIAIDDVFHLVDVSADRSKQTTMADLAAAIGGVVGSGTVTSVSVVTANGVSGTVANPTTTPAITLALGAITPTSVNSVVISGASSPTLAVTGTSSVSNDNTGDQTITLTGDVTGSGTSTFAATLATVATAGTSGSSVAIPVVTIDQKGRVLSATTTAVIAPAGTLTGTTVANNVLFSSLTSVGTLTAGTWSATTIAVTKGGTGLTSYTPYALVAGGTTSTGNLQQITSLGSSGQVLTSAGAGALPTWATPTTGTVTMVSVVTANGISGTVANPTTAPAITIALAAITPTTVNGLTIVSTTGTLSLSSGVTLTVPSNATVSNTNTGDQPFTASGDATAPSSTSTLVLTIGNDVVTYAKMQNVSATSRILGRRSSGVGDVEECTLTQILDFVGLAAQGDVLFRNASTWTKLAAGTSGQFLKTLGTGADPIWDGVSGASGGTVTSVAISGANGLSVVSGSPVTTSGTIALAIGNVGGTTPITVNGLTITPSTGTVTVLNGKTVTLNNTLTYNGTDGSAIQFGGGGTVAYISDKLSAFAPTTSAELAATISDETGTNKLVFSDNAALSTPTITAPNVTGGFHVAQTKLGIRSTGTGTFDLVIKDTENLTAERNLTVVMGDADRTLTFAGNATISNVNSGDQLYIISGSDATAPSSASNLVLTLATVATAGTTGSSTAIPVITIDQKGRVLSISTAAVVAPAGTLTGTILASNVVTSSLTSIGTITTGVWTGTTIAIANGGTGAATASGARTNLGLVIGTDVQAWDTQLDSLATLAYSSNSLKAVRVNAGETGFELYTPTTGTMTTVSVVTANGISGSVANPTTTPAITLTLGAITPTTVNGLTITTTTGTLTVTNGKTLSVPLDASVSGTNTGDQSFIISGSDATAPSSASDLVLTLATVATAGTTGGSTAIPVVTIDAKGRTLSITTAAVVAPAGTLTGTALASNVVASSLTTVGTIGTGVWQGTKIGLAYGGTNADLSATGGTSQVLMQTSMGAAITVAQLAANDLSNGTSGSGAVALVNSPSFTTPSLGSAFFDVLFSNSSSGLIKANAATLTSIGIQAYNSGTSSYKTLATFLSGTTPKLFLDDETYVGGNFVYREFQGINFGKRVRVDDGGTGAGSFTAYAIVCAGTTSTGTFQNVSGVGTSGQVLTSNGASALPTWQTPVASGGTVTSVSVVTANGVSGSVASPTTTPAITLVLGDITPTSVVTTNKVRSGTSSNGVLAVWDNANSVEITLTGGNSVLTLGGSSTPSLALASNLLMPLGSSVNWNGGDVLLTHSSNLVTLTGGNLSLGGTNAIVSGYWLGNTVDVVVGGSGRTTAIAYAPICGGTGSSGASVTTAHQSVASAGNSGEVFVSQGGTTLPTWSTFTALMNTWKATVTGYDGSRRQFLTHSSAGTFEWKNVSATC